MTPMLFATAVLAGIVYVLTPGPATLAVLGLSAAHGRAKALRFFAGHGVGDMTWSALALAALLGASRLGPELFHGLGIVCGLYLAWLGLKALTARDSGEAKVIGAEAPLRTGVIFGLTNPKAYPFALAMYGALAVQGGATFGVREAMLLFFATTLGMAIGDLITVAWTGLAPVSRLFLRFRMAIQRAMGGLFLAFGGKTAFEAGRALMR
jgi:threonine/homoserine/homoserine lactone efflux protein